tara:strand:- start:390 stop:578 length:189 start_codon:yes stop_codon:yes gene_type:complete
MTSLIKLPHSIDPSTIAYNPWEPPPEPAKPPTAAEVRREALSPKVIFGLNCNRMTEYFTVLI